MTQETASKPSPAFRHMKTALDIAPRSPHPKNKIAAVLFGTNEKGMECVVIRTNHWPDDIYEKIGTKQKIGNSSGTIHAETACLGNSNFSTEGASICITDPFCPNCAKNMAEAGIKNIYIDQNGFGKDFFKRRGKSFAKMSMQVCEKAGINVYAINMLTEEISTILEIEKNYTPAEDSPIRAEPIESANDAILHDIVEAATQRNHRRKFAIALVEDQAGKRFGLTARAHAVIGYSMEKKDEAQELLTPVGKYSFIQEPVNRLVMHMARKGYRLIDDYLYCSQVPTSREQVNLVGAGIKRISVGDIQKCRDPEGIKAMGLLSKHKILDYS